MVAPARVKESKNFSYCTTASFCYDGAALKIRRKDKGEIMRRLDPNQIREEFNQRKQAFTKEHAENGLADAIEDLSRVVGDLKAGGLDVELEFFGCPSDQAFQLFPFKGALIVPVSGILRIGRLHRLLAIATKVDGAPALRLGLSEFDIRFAGPQASFILPAAEKDAGAKEIAVGGKVRSTVYDLKTDPDALVKFQTEVIRHAARNAFVDDHDVGGAFDNGVTLGKTGLRIPPKP
jgi:hypothetical protein